MMKFFITILITLISIVGSAGSLEVQPLKVGLSESNQIQSVTIRNLSDLDVVVSLKLYKWEYINNKDKYTLTQDLLVTPPIVKIPKKATQIARIGIIKPHNYKKETSYRLYIHEVIDQDGKKLNSLQIALRIGIPVFVQPNQQIKENLKWQVENKNDNKIILSVKNNGNGHVTLNKLELSELKNKSPFLSKKIFKHLLAGATYQWEFELDKTNISRKDKLELIASTNIGNLTALIMPSNQL